MGTVEAEKLARIYSCVASIHAYQAQIYGMASENQHQSINGQDVAYRDEAFTQVSNSLHDLAATLADIAAEWPPC